MRLGCVIKTDYCSRGPGNSTRVTRKIVQGDERLLNNWDATLSIVTYFFQGGGSSGALLFLFKAVLFAKIESKPH